MVVEGDGGRGDGGGSVGGAHEKSVCGHANAIPPLHPSIPPAQPQIMS